LNGDFDGHNIGITPRTMGGEGGLPASGFSSTSPVPDASVTDGLAGEGSPMTQSVSVHAGCVPLPSTAFVEMDRGRFRWRISQRHVAVLRLDGIDWFDLQAGPTASRVKHSSHREVWRVVHHGRAYYVKLYHPEGFVARAKARLFGSPALHEYNVALYAAAHAVNAVAPVAAAWQRPNGLGVTSLLMTEAAEGVEALSDAWLKVRACHGQAVGLIDAVARLVARAHQCGFRHGDLHPGNVLVRFVDGAWEALFVDLYDVRVGWAVSAAEMIANLAQLNQWFRSHATRAQRLRFLRGYLKSRDAFALASPWARNRPVAIRELLVKLAAQADRHADRLWAKRDRRSRRNGQYFAKIRPAPGWRGLALLRSKHPSPSAAAARSVFTRSQWERWLASPSDWADPRKQTLLKDSHTALVFRARLPVEDGAAEVVVKRPLARTLLKRILHAVGPSRNMRSWKTANMLLNRNLPVAQPLAVVERYAAGLLRTDSVCISDFVVGAVDLEVFLAQRLTAWPAERRLAAKGRLTETMVGLLRRFSDRGFAHRDFKASNLLVSWPEPLEGPPVLTLVDLEGVRYVGTATASHRNRILVRLAASLPRCPGCTRTDRLRFLKRYLTSPRATPRGWKDVWREIQGQVDAKLRSKERRRRWKIRRYGRE